ncbi:hypothetical protein ACFPM7_17050 [Actinokineospora guangxiensis]|jgi:hypothetical protein|uniref:Uncharacterized protein n=1 Tax=Actinokineospora guangxiensis TaxID=1490288 RepID=A0ABW0EMU7_9PSEU
MDTAEPHELTARTRAMLRAIAAGRGTLRCGREPHLYIDGVPCCDQFSAHALIHDGLVATPPGPTGQFVPATLTPAGSAALDLATAAA